MNRVQNRDVEDLDRSRLSTECVDIVGHSVETLDKGVGGGETVRQVDSFRGVILLFFGLERVIHALHEAEPVGARFSRVQRDRPQVHTETLPQLLMDFVSPVETLNSHPAVLVMEVAQTRAKGALKSIFHLISSLFGPLRAI